MKYVIKEEADCQRFIDNVPILISVGKISPSQALDGCPFYHHNDGSTCSEGKERECALRRFLEKQSLKKQ